MNDSAIKKRTSGTVAKGKLSTTAHLFARRISQLSNGKRYRIELVKVTDEVWTVVIDDAHTAEVIRGG